jgi:hypothetical protein
MATHIHALAFDHIKIGLQGLGELLEHIHHYKIQGIAHLPQVHLATLTFPSIQPSLQLDCWQALGLVASPITGPAGNHEYLLWLGSGRGAEGVSERPGLSTSAASGPCLRPDLEQNPSLGPEPRSGAEPNTTAGAGSGAVVAAKPSKAIRSPVLVQGAGGLDGGLIRALVAHTLASP